MCNGDVVFAFPLPPKLRILHVVVFQPGFCENLSRYKAGRCPVGVSGEAESGFEGDHLGIPLLLISASIPHTYSIQLHTRTYADLDMPPVTTYILALERLSLVA
jgi:hypothetical protein